MLYIGDLVNTHGIKGEVRINSLFKYKDIVFQKNNFIYINNEKLMIVSHRVHKGYNMVKFDGYEDINDVLKFKGCKVYILKDDYVFPGIVNEELYGRNVYVDEKIIGTLKEIVNNNGQELFVVQGARKYLIPNVSEFVKDINERGIYINAIKGLIDEN